MSHREDTRSHTEADAQRAEAHRVQVTGEDTDACDDGFTRSTWDPANVPQRILDEARRAPRDCPPF